jgi:hypothetical protein
MVSTACKSVNAALAVGPIAILPMMLFGGLYISLDQIPVYLRWLKALSFFKYAFEILGLNQFKGHPITIMQAGFTEDDYYSDFYWLIGLVVAFRVFAFIFLYVRARVETKVKTL